MVQHVDFTSEAFFRSPEVGVASLRASGPVVTTKFPIIGRVWVTTTYEAAARVLKDSAYSRCARRAGRSSGCPGGCRN